MWWMERRLIDRAVPAVLALFGVSLAWGLGHSANPGPVGFPLDDAWIHLVYGRGLLENGYLAYNDGVPSTGCTSPLWAGFLALARLPAGDAPGDAVPYVLLLGAALHVAGAVTAAGLAQDRTGSRLAGGAAGALVGLAPPLAVAALSGMEVALTALLLLLAVGAAAAGHAGRTGILLALAFLARPESAVPGALLFAWVVAASPAGERPRTAVRFLAAPVAAGLALVAWNLAASGRPLPATFYAKSSASPGDLPQRLGVAFGRILPDVPPFALGLGWVALTGLLPFGRRAGATDTVRRALPFLAGLAFLLANLAVLDPADPDAFYHRRYLYPAVPLLLVAVVIGAHGLGERLRGRARPAPVAALLVLGAIGVATGAGPASRHLHNDVRNINEVQRALGTRLGQRLAPGTRIAASDAGAVRYFSRLPTIDVIGLNTPEMQEPDAEFVASHPVAALVLLPAWFASPDADRLRTVDEATTEDYTVTSDPRMARQIVLVAEPIPGPDAPATVRVPFGGFHRFVLDFVVPRPAGSRGG
jgi:hypothetical protein